MTYAKLFDYINKEQMIEDLKSSEELYKTLNINFFDVHWYGIIWNRYGEIKKYPIVGFKVDGREFREEDLFTRYYYDKNLSEINMIFHNIYDFELSLQA